MRYNVKQMFNPFAGKSEKEILILMSSQHVREEEKILYANMEMYFDELELEISATNPETNFYRMTRAKQRAKLYEKVKATKEAIQASQPDPETLLG